jgi:hypothetical protein
LRIPAEMNESNSLNASSVRIAMFMGALCLSLADGGAAPRHGQPT